MLYSAACAAGGSIVPPWLGAGAAAASAQWAVEVKTPGEYEITLYRWPPYLRKEMGANEARLSIGGTELTQSIPVTATKASFRLQLNAGETMLQTWLTRPDGKQHGAYYTEVRKTE